MRTLIIICLLLLPFSKTVLFSQAPAKNVKNPNGGAGLTHYPGEFYGGGIVIAAWATEGVEHGLIVSMADIADSVKWSDDTATLIGANAQSLTDGQANTNAIIARLGPTYSAAQLCRKYNGGGYSDWYLPSMSELRLFSSSMNLVSYRLGLLHVANSHYWSSSEYSNNMAWNENFSQYIGWDWVSKRYICAVRAFRKY